MVNLRKREGD